MYPFLPDRNMPAALRFTNKYKSYFRLLEKKKTENELKKCQVSSLFRLEKLLLTIIQR